MIRNGIPHMWKRRYNTIYSIIFFKTKRYEKLNMCCTVKPQVCLICSLEDLTRHLYPFN